MARLAELERSLETMRELEEIVGALRSVAASRVRQAEQAREGITAYQKTMHAAMSEAVALAGGGLAEGVASPHALILLCSEHGFVGALNDRLLDKAAKVERDALWVVGTRGAGLCEERGMAVDWSRPAATRAEAVLSVCRELAARLYRELGSGNIAGAAVLFPAHDPTTGTTLELRTVVPPDPSDLEVPGNLPMTYLQPSALLEAVVAEHVLGELSWAAMQAFAAENDARLRTMLAAHHHIEQRISELEQQAHLMRQEEITSELLDLVEGAEAARDDHP